MPASRRKKSCRARTRSSRTWHPARSFQAPLPCPIPLLCHLRGNLVETRRVQSKHVDIPPQLTVPSEVQCKRSGRLGACISPRVTIRPPGAPRSGDDNGVDGLSSSFSPSGIPPPWRTRPAHRVHVWSVSTSMTPGRRQVSLRLAPWRRDSDSISDNSPVGRSGAASIFSSRPFRDHECRGRGMAWTEKEDVRCQPRSPTAALAR